MRYKCDKCNWYNKEFGAFGDSDYVICEKCGRLLVSHNRREEIIHNRKVTPHVLIFSTDIDSVRTMAQALYDPRKVISSGLISDLRPGHGNKEYVISRDRDIAEIMTINTPAPNDRALYNWVMDFKPHVIILKLDCTVKEDISDRLVFLKNVAKMSDLTSMNRVPIIVVLDNADKVEPVNEKTYGSYSVEKQAAIKKMKEYYRQVITESGLLIEDIVPISSYMEWGVKEDHKSGEGVYAEDLKIVCDGRYNIDRLRKIIGGSVSMIKGRYGKFLCEWM